MTNTNNNNGKQKNSSKIQTKEETLVALITAPLAKYRVMWLVRLKVPVSQTPGGTYSIVPPFLLKCSILYTAFRNGHVFSVRPSPTPPKSAMDIVSARFLHGTMPAQLTSECTEEKLAASVTRMSSSSSPRGGATAMAAALLEELQDEDFDGGLGSGKGEEKWAGAGFWISCRWTRRDLNANMEENLRTKRRGQWW